MLGNLFKKNKELPEEEIKKQREVWLQQMLEKSQELDRLIKASHTGWEEFCLLLEDYIDKAKKRKAITALDKATDAELYQLKLLDHEVYILNWVLRIPEQFIKQVEVEIKKNDKEQA